MFCIKCGEKLDESAAFCPYCGNRVAVWIKRGAYNIGPRGDDGELSEAGETGHGRRSSAASGKPSYDKGPAYADKRGYGYREEEPAGYDEEDTDGYPGEEPEEEAEEGAGRRRIIRLAVIIASLLAIIAAVLCIVLLSRDGRGKKPGGTAASVNTSGGSKPSGPADQGSVTGASVTTAEAPGTASGSEGASSANDSSTDSEKIEAPVVTQEAIASAKYTEIRSPGEVNLLKRKHAPGEKLEGLDFDGSLLERLEGTGETPGRLAACRLSRLRRRKSDGRNIEFEIYTDPKSEEIYKVTTIEDRDDVTFNITDYYYNDGRPYYTYARRDSVNTPLYPSTEKPGVHYYFNYDALVRCRTVLDDLSVSQTGLVRQNIEGYEEFGYFDAPEAVRAQYEQFENEQLNRSYCVYEAVTGLTDHGDGAAVIAISGTVVDPEGGPAVDRSVYLQRISDGKIEYGARTDRNGSFSLNAYVDGFEYQLYVAGTRVYDDAYVRGIMLERDKTQYSCGRIVLGHQGSERHTVVLKLCDAAGLDTRNGKISGWLSDATVKARKGENTRTGSTVWKGRSDGSGRVNASLAPGSYTLEIKRDGYALNYINIDILEKTFSSDIYMVREPEEGQAAVLLTWENGASADKSRDLDLTVFTPYFGTAGNMRSISWKDRMDTRGNLMISDNSYGCEVAYINAGSDEPFRVYVSDYTDCAQGNGATGSFSELNARVYIYTSDGDVKELMAPGGRGLVWDAAFVHGLAAAPSGRLYMSVSGKPWWKAKKSESDLSADSGAIKQEAMGNIVQ